MLLRSGDRPDQQVTAFRANIGETVLAGLHEHFPRIERSTTSSTVSYTHLIRGKSGERGRVI